MLSFWLLLFADFCVGVQFGSCTSNLSTQVIKMYSKDPRVAPFDPTTDYIVSLLSVSVLVGSMVGSMAVAHLMDRFGRRRVAIVSSCLAAACNVLTMVPVHWAYLFAMRVLLGVPSAALKTTFPAWVSELAGVAQRGTLNVCLQLFFSVGMVTSSLMLLLIGTRDALWFTSFLPTTFFCLISVVFCWLLPEPERPQQSVAAVAQAPEAASWRELFSRRYARVLAAAVCLGVAQQGSGVNSVLLYATATFQHAFSDDPDDYYSAIYGSLLITTVNFLCTCLALPSINRLGRRVMYFGGFSLVALGQALFVLCYSTSTATWLLITASCVFLFGFEAGPGPCFFVLTGELFPLRARAKLCGLSFTVNWLTCIFVVMIFPFFGGAEQFAYLIYFCLTASAVAVMWFVMPETKGKTLQQIEREAIGEPAQQDDELDTLYMDEQ